MSQRTLGYDVQYLDNTTTNERLITVVQYADWEIKFFAYRSGNGTWSNASFWKKRSNKTYGAILPHTTTQICLGDSGSIEDLNNNTFPTSGYVIALPEFGTVDTTDSFTDEDLYGKEDSGSGSGGDNTGGGDGSDSDDDGIAALSECTALAPTVAKHTELINNNTAAINELKGKLNNYYTKDEINDKLDSIKTQIEELEDAVNNKLDEFEQQLDDIQKQVEDKLKEVNDRLDEVNNTLNGLGDMGVTILTEDGEYVPHTTGEHICILVGGGGGSFGYGYKLKVTNDLTWYPMQSGVPALVYWFVINLEKDKPYRVTIGKGGVGYSANKVIQDNGLIIYTDESNSGALQTLYNKYYENNTGGNTTFDTYIAYGGRGGVEVIPDNTPCISSYHALESITAGYRYDDPVSRLYLPKYGCAGTITNTDRAELTMLDEIAHGTNGVAIIIG